MQFRAKRFVLNENAANIYFYIWIPASQPSRHSGSTPRKITQ